MAYWLKSASNGRYLLMGATSGLKKVGSASSVRVNVTAVSAMARYAMRESLRPCTSQMRPKRKKKRPSEYPAFSNSHLAFGQTRSVRDHEIQAKCQVLFLGGIIETFLLFQKRRCGCNGNPAFVARRLQP